MATLDELLIQRAEIDKQIEATRKKERANAISQATKLINEFQLTAQECGFGGKTGKTVNTPAKTVAAKFRSADGNTWSGRGKAPRWLVDYEKNGGSRENLRIK